jgi:hypothetical protein
MDDKEKDLFDKGEVNVEWADPTLETRVKDCRDQMMHYYAVVVGDPYKASTVLDDMRRNLLSLCASLMEYNIPINLPKKERTAEDVLKEAAGELGSMFGAQGVTAGLSFARRVKENISSGALVDIYEAEDEDGDMVYFFFNENEEEVMCDEEGIPLDEEEED